MTETSAKRLIVIRHSKTEQFATSDHVRKLTERGERDALDVGRWLAAEAIVPSVVLVSSAARATRTADLVCEGLGADPTVTVQDALYSASGRDALEACAELPDDVECAAIIGHNPTMAVLADALVAEDGQIRHFPTSAAAVIEFDGAWSELDEGAGTLMRLHTPHDS